MVHSRFIRRSLVVGTIVTNLAAIALIPCGDTDEQSETQQPAAQVQSAGSTGSTNSSWFGEIQRLLAGIPTGNAALMVLEDYEVSVTLEAGQGSYYVPAHIVIDSDWGIVAAAVDLVHEATHARFRSEGLTPDPMSVTRDEYVARRIEEEAESQANAIQAKIELEAMEIDASEARPWFEMQYRSAYGEAVEWKRTNSKTTEAELRQFGWEMGKNELIKGFTGGEAVASNGELHYSEIYGREWDTFAAYKATQSGSGDEAAAAAPKSKALELDADPMAEEANDVPVDSEPAGLTAFGSIVSALAREGLSALADGLLQLVYSVFSWRAIRHLAKILYESEPVARAEIDASYGQAEGLEDLYRASTDSEAVEVAGKAVHRGEMIQIVKLLTKA